MPSQITFICVFIHILTGWALGSIPESLSEEGRSQLPAGALICPHSFDLYLGHFWDLCLLAHAGQPTESLHQSFALGATPAVPPFPLRTALATQSLPKAGEHCVQSVNKALGCRSAA